MRRTRLWPAAAAAGGASLALLAQPTLAQAATGSEPAGGAAMAEVIGATAGAVVVTALLALVIAGHRTGRIRVLARLARLSERVSGLPAWAALPSAVLGVSLLTAVLGMYWDISLHIDNGRDPGPLANPAHYLILVGLYGVLFAGVLTAALARERPSATAVRLGAGWWAPLGGIVIAACGAFALSGFPLDDLWHRIFGQDVTLWGPTHLMLIGGGSLAMVGAMILFTEAVNAVGREPSRGSAALLRFRQVMLVGGFLVALSTFQGEFDFGVPQFRLVLHPVLLMIAAGVGLVTARLYLGRGGALYAVLGFVAIRGLLALMVGGVWGQTTPHFPLYVVEALLVELVFARLGARGPVVTGAVAGLAIGTVGLAAEWGWSHVWMPISWPSALLPEAVLLGVPAAVAGGVLGAFIGSSLTRPRPLPLPRSQRLTALGAGLAVAAIVGYGLPLSTDGPERASVSLRDVRSGQERAVEATVRMHPPDAVEGVEFLNVTAWQGGGSVVRPLERVRRGVYRSTEPVPVHNGWKAVIRVHDGRGLVSVPIYMPADRAIPAPTVPARATFTREFQRDVELLQRERKDDVSGVLSISAHLSVLAIALSLMALLAWCLLRLQAGDGGRRSGSPRLAESPAPRQPELV